MANISDFEEFKASRPDIEEALRIVDRKFPYISHKAPNGSVREEIKIKANIFHGAIAQIAVENVLRNYGATDIEIYDRIRTDEFRNPDPFDIRCTFKNLTVLVEVRSSYITQPCMGFSEIAGILNCIRTRYNLIAEYKTSYKPGEARKGLFFQVYWTYSESRAIEIYSSYLKNIPDKAEGCFVLGLATQKLIAAKGRVSNLGQRDANFNLVRIPDIFPCTKLSELTNLKNSE